MRLLWFPHFFHFLQAVNTAEGRHSKNNSLSPVLTLYRYLIANYMIAI
jgi:hypothetical protein